MALINTYWPSKEYADTITLLRVRLITVICLLVGALGTLIAFSSLEETSAVAPLHSIAGIFVPFAFLFFPLLRLTGASHKHLAHAICLVLLVHLTIMSTAADGRLAIVAAYLSFLPMVGTVLLGPRSGGVYLAATIFIFTVLTSAFIGKWSTITMCVLSVFGTSLTIVIIEELERAAKNLMSSRDSAVAADHAKSKFLAEISHEIRTPLSGVVGMTDVLSRSNLDDAQREQVNVIKTCTDQLHRVVNGVLDISKLEAEAVELDIVDTAIDDLINSIAAAFQPIADKKGLEIITALAPSLPSHCRTDPTRLTQIISNLVSNAIKFTDNGTITINAKAKAPDESGNIKLIFSVTDTGAGMDQATIERVFRPYTQADASTARRHGGTGLGLPIAKGLVELLGGTITAQSELGRGTCFQFDVIAMPTIQNGTAPNSKPAPNTGTAPNSKRADVEKMAEMSELDILVAEDNATNRRVIEFIISPGVRSIAFAGNGAEAIELWRQNKPDLILMDIQMPIMDGTTATAIIRNEERVQNQPRTPIIALTANVLDTQVKEYLNAGTDDVVAKPINLELLEETISKLINKTRGRFAA